MCLHNQSKAQFQALLSHPSTFLTILLQPPRYPPTNPLRNPHIRNHRVHPARARKYTRINHIQPLRLPCLCILIHNAGLGRASHPTRAHLMSGRKGCVRQWEALRAEEVEPGCECWVVDSGVHGIFSGRGRRTDEWRHPARGGENLRRALNIENATHPQQPLYHALSIPSRRGILNPAASIHGVRKYGASIPIAIDNHEPGHVSKLGG
jgi:hypothetical protein